MLIQHAMPGTLIRIPDGVSTFIGRPPFRSRRELSQGDIIGVVTEAITRNGDEIEHILPGDGHYACVLTSRMGIVWVYVPRCANFSKGILTWY